MYDNGSTLTSARAQRSNEVGEAMRQLTRVVSDDTRVRSTLLPFSGGTYLIVKN